MEERLRETDPALYHDELMVLVLCVLEGHAHERYSAGGPVGVIDRAVKGESIGS